MKNNEQILMRRVKYGIKCWNEINNFDDIIKSAFSLLMIVTFTWQVIVTGEFCKNQDQALEQRDQERKEQKKRSESPANSDCTTSIYHSAADENYGSSGDSFYYSAGGWESENENLRNFENSSDSSTSSSTNTITSDDYEDTVVYEEILDSTTDAEFYYRNSNFSEKNCEIFFKMSKMKGEENLKSKPKRSRLNEMSEKEVARDRNEGTVLGESDKELTATEKPTKVVTVEKEPTKAGTIDNELSKKDTGDGEFTEVVTVVEELIETVIVIEEPIKRVTVIEEPTETPIEKASEEVTVIGEPIKQVTVIEKPTEVVTATQEPSESEDAKSTISPTLSAQSEENWSDEVSSEDAGNGTKRLAQLWPTNISHLLETDAVPMAAGTSAAGAKQPNGRPSPPPPPPPPPRSSPPRSPLPRHIQTKDLEETNAETEESPPIIVETIGVQRDAMRAARDQRESHAVYESREEQEQRGYTSATEESEKLDDNNDTQPSSAYLYFGQRVHDDADGYFGAEVLGIGRRAHDSTGGAANPLQHYESVPLMRFLDAIIEEESDELRSAQSSRASSFQQADSPLAQHHHQPQQQQQHITCHQDRARQSPIFSWKSEAISEAKESVEQRLKDPEQDLERLIERKSKSKDKNTDPFSEASLRIYDIAEVAAAAQSAGPSEHSDNRPVPRLDFSCGFLLDEDEPQPDSNLQEHILNRAEELATYSSNFFRELDVITRGTVGSRGLGLEPTPVLKSGSWSHTPSPDSASEADTILERSIYEKSEQKSLQHPGESSDILGLGPGPEPEQGPLLKQGEFTEPYAKEALKDSTARNASTVAKDRSSTSSTVIRAKDLLKPEKEQMYDTDRDQSEMFVSISEQYACPTPPEDGQISSTSISLNMDRSRDDLDESLCSHPRGDATISHQQFDAASLIETPSILPILQRDREIESKKSEKKFTRIYDNEDEDALPAPPSIARPIEYEIERRRAVDDVSAAAVAGQLAESVVQAAIRELHEKSATETNQTPRQIEERTPPTRNELDITSRYDPVRPLSGRTERIVSYIYGGSDVGLTNGHGPGPTKMTEVPILVKQQPIWRTRQAQAQAHMSIAPLGAESNKENWRQSKTYVSSLTPNVTFATDNGKDQHQHQHQHHVAYDSAPLGDGRQAAGVERDVPIRRYSPLNIDSTMNQASSPYPARLFDVSPQQTYQMYELRRRHHTVSTTHRNLPNYRMADSIRSENLSQPRSEFYRNAQRDEFMNAQDFAELSSIGANVESQFQRSSRSTVRDIPIQRSTSAFAPTSTTYEKPYHQHSREMSGFSSGAPVTVAGGALPGQSSTTLYTTSRTPGGPGAEEYYRREVLTRTLVTRSTEGLSGGAPLPPPPLGRSSPIADHFRQLPELPRDEVSEEYWYKYSRNIEEEERRIRENQEKRQKEEEERRAREDELRRRWELQQQEHLERFRIESQKKEKDLENMSRERERLERDRVERDRIERENAEMLRRQEWERIENERRKAEELELQRRRELERLEKERLERERIERERIEMERLERERLAQEKLEKERLERERIERERIEIERLEIERIERIKRERREKEERERERQRKEAERLEQERLEAERLERERLELERRERELIEMQRREAEQRERERREDELREQQRRAQEQRERELLMQAEREAAEREAQRKYREKMEQERLENLRREQERLDFEKAEAERRERQRLEDERREKELLEAQLCARERREQERLEELRREAQRQEEERREQDRRARERALAQERERQRAIEEQAERERLAALETAAAERRAQRMEEERLERNRNELERRAEELRDLERREAEKRERERMEEERRLAELRELERRNAEKRDAERREAAEREAGRRKDDRRSRDRLDQIVREREECERWEVERKRVLAEREAQERRRQALTSKETLERLTRKPYFSRENLSGIGQPEVTTKVERQVIERVDRTLWTSDELRGGGGVLSDRRPLPLGSASALDQRVSPTSDFGYAGAGAGDYGGGAAARERIYNPRDDEFRRGGSTRTSKYKARMERARKEFLLHATEPLSDPIEDRFRKSNEDIRRRVEYRGPLLQKFHDSDISRTDYGSAPPPYSRGVVGGSSPYDHTSVDDPYRSKSVFDYESTHYRHSRRDLTTDGDANAAGGIGCALDGGAFDASQHSRSKSADYMMDRRIREDLAAPENELQKSEYNRTTETASPDGRAYHQREASEHEMRFRKSTERLPMPDWYREHVPASATSSGALADPYGRPATATTSGVFSTSTHRGTSYQTSTNTSPAAATVAATGGAPPVSLPLQKYTFMSSTTPTPLQVRHYSASALAAQQPWSYTAGDAPLSPSGAISPPVGGIAFPPGMFDRYKDEIEDMRRSRTSLHQLGGASAAAQLTVGATPQEHAKDDHVEYVQSMTREYKREAHSTTDVRFVENGATHQPGYTVYSVPSDWNVSPDRNSRVIEVADTFVGKPEMIPASNRASRFGGRVTVEEVLDSIFQDMTPNLNPINPSSAHNEQPAVYDPEGPCIFAPDSEKMRLIIEQPHLIDSIIDTSTLQIRCTRCALTQSLCEAGFVSCKHCYKYYCSRACRVADWDRHRDRCSFARINTLCKEVIMKVRRDHETQFQMSKVAREGFVREGRGSVNIRLMSAHFAQRYLADGWRAFANEDPNHLLFYYSIPRLIEQRKEPSIVQLCKRYNPNEKFILSVSIIADIECCPETPPPEPSRDAFESSSAAAAESDDNGAQPPRPPRTLSRFSNTSASTVARQPAYASRARHAGGMAYGGAVVPTNV